MEALFFKYVFQNILGMVGVSAYVLADTFFISVANGADGIATLNLALPLYNFIFAIGQMLGIGAGIRFSIYRATGDARADRYFSNSILWAFVISLPFMLLGFLNPGGVLRLMGGDATIVALGVPYVRIELICAPFFMLNYIFNAFTRNDEAPTRAMIATVSSSLFNILFDYIFIFPCGMGMTGAALATGLSPLLGVAICSGHIFSKKSHVKLEWHLPSLHLLWQSCQLGVSAFVGEFAGGVTTIVFNTLILGLAGNNGVAAYGIIANVSIVVIAILNGIAQGGQPLFSHYYGSGERDKVQKILRYSILTAAAAGVLVIACAWIWPEAIASVFNSEGNDAMLEMAITGLRIYFAGTIFAGFNIVATGYFGAVDRAFECSLISILRGVVLIILMAILLAALFGMNGVWAAFPAAEGVTMLAAILALMRKKKE